MKCLVSLVSVDIAEYFIDTTKDLLIRIYNGS